MPEMSPEPELPPGVIRVVIVEDHAELRESWQRVVEGSERMECLASFATAEEALRMIPGLVPDVVLMDINLPGISGIECTRRLKREHPEIQILIFTVYKAADKIFEALEAGASGYLLKRTSPEKLLEGIEEVRVGGSPMTSEVARMVVRSFRRPVSSETVEAKLTPREEEILGLLARGFVTKEIASELGISYFTVQTHLKKIYEKLHVRSRTEAVLKYLG
jgi:DNA-binding NarL/FixJ family response regulator